MEFFGIASSVVIAIGLLCVRLVTTLSLASDTPSLSPQYYEIWKHKEVIGISVPFMTIDMLGGVFNDLSLAFKDKFIVLAAITYTLVVVSFQHDLIYDTMLTMLGIR